MPRTISLAVLLMLAPGAGAGVYDSQEKCPFPINAAGVAEELSYGPRAEGAFPSLFATLLNAADGNPTRRDNPDRQRLLDRLAAPPPVGAVGLADRAALHLRLGRPDDALNWLAPQSRALEFRGLANLAHAYAQRGEWADALRWHQSALLDADFPDDLAGATPEQRQWLRSVEKTHYRRWLDRHHRRAEAKAPPADEGVFPLFADPPPADAVAVVQQLTLWAPWDGALVWLLATLYADAGRVREADILFQQCVEGRQMSNRRQLMSRRAEVRDAVARLPKEAPPEEVPLAGPSAPPEDPAAFLPSRERLIGAAVAFAAILTAGAALQLRAWRRRRGR